MKRTIRSSIQIKASKEKVWDVLLQDKTYRQWASVISPGSYAETDWKEGSTVYVKTPDGNGFASSILSHVPSERISLEHVGVLKRGRESSDHPEIRDLRGYRETYRVEEKEGVTTLFIEQDISEERLETSAQTWKQALRKIKDISEK